MLKIFWWNSNFEPSQLDNLGLLEAENSGVHDEMFWPMN